MKTNSEAIGAIVLCLTKGMDEDELRERLSDLQFMWTSNIRKNDEKTIAPTDATLLTMQAFNAVADLVYEEVSD